MSRSTGSRQYRRFRCGLETAPYSIGTFTPGDLVSTGGHVAIHVGSGRVVIGGLNGMNTGVHHLSDLSDASFVHVR